MELTFNIIGLVTAGIAISAGISCLAQGILDQHDKDFLVFGIMSLFLAAYFLAPPLGFIIDARAPYTFQIEFKRVFIFGYYMLIPLFLSHYTGFKIKYIYNIVGVPAVISYILMVWTPAENLNTIWFLFALLIFLIILIYGIRAGIWQYKNGNKRDAHYLLFSMFIYGVLFILTVVHQFYQLLLLDSIGNGLFFPFHLHSISFFAIMGFRFLKKSFEKHKLERLLSIRNFRWNIFMRMAPFVVLELDKQGNIRHINDFGCKFLGINASDNVTGKNWIEKFIFPADQQKCVALLNDLVSREIGYLSIKVKIRKSDGKNPVINWISFLADTHDMVSDTIMCVGSDVSEEEFKNDTINALRSELEKEKLLIPYQNNLNSDELLGQSQAIRYVLQKVNLVAGTMAPVLIEGETGVGKELVADMIFKNSSRADKPFIKVNCGAFPKELIEDELFGHEKGAFTSAVQARKGRFELADGGTIFLDEIGELPIDLQPRLLRVLQDGQFERIGGQATMKVNVRIIAATNRILNQEIKNGRFREDLFYRLNVFPITIPPLRKRNEDLKTIIDHYIAYYSKIYKKTLLNISKADLQRLMEYDWPGNVRELKNMIERSVLSSTGSTLKIDGILNEEDLDEQPVMKSLKNMEHQYILNTLEQCRWKINGSDGAADKLNMHPNTLRSKMKKLGISRPI